MRPHENGYGVVLETVEEAQTVNQALTTAAEYFKEGAQHPDMSDAVDTLNFWAAEHAKEAQELGDRLDLYSVGDQTEEFAISLANPGTRARLRTALDITRRRHADSEVRDAATDMQISLGRLAPETSTLALRAAGTSNTESATPEV